MLEFFDVYLLEAVISGILLGGVLALIALGLGYRAVTRRA